MASKQTTIADWLIEASQLRPGDQLEIWLGDEKAPPPTFQDMRDALHAQYGQDTLIRIHKHGQRISIFIHPDEESRQRFDRRSARIVIRSGDKRTEIESGFEREL